MTTTTSLSNAATGLTGPELAEDAREHIASHSSAFTVDGVPQVNDTLSALFELNELAESHTIMVDNAEFAGVTAAEIEAAREHLALHHRVVDMIAGQMAGWVVEGELSPAPAIRAGLYAALRTERLAQSLCQYDTYAALRAADAAA
jgi:hypothetical protein